ncbi:hypothetical protein LIER_25924 [Lithospermum erythrorhizon]|uniref:Retrotransposon gag protein n=1 Tax=Lithospermum erythrorhizon TaxID=34254 RepID=A0AAV3R836_LITER
MELNIAANQGHVPSTPAAFYSKAKYNPRKPKETSNLKKKEEHVVTSKETKFAFKTKNFLGRLVLGRKERLTHKEMQEKEYPFLDCDIPTMFDKLLKARLIKRPEEARRSTEPNFYKYHRILGHPIEKSFIFKERVMDLARKGEITLEEDKVSSNHITLTIVQPAQVNVPDGFCESKLTHGKAWVDNSDDEDHEAYHVSALPLKGCVTPQEGPKTEHDTMNPKAYDLLLKAGYDPTKDKAIG